MPLVETRQMKPDDFPAVYKFLKEHYYEAEPLHAYLHKTETKDFRYLDRCERDAKEIEDKTSFLSVNSLGEIVALVLSGWVSNIPPYVSSAPSHIYPKMQKLLLSAKACSNEILKLNENDKELGLGIICVHPNWAGKGLAKYLVEETVAVAKSNDCTIIRAFCTSAFSAKLLEKHGFECVYQIKYEDYSDENGEVVFKLPPPHLNLKIMVLKDFNFK